MRDIREGIAFIANASARARGHRRLGVGLIGGGAMIPLGPVFAKQGLGGDAATFGVLMTALGIGAAIGVVVLLLLQRRLPRETVFEFAIMGTGVFLVLARVAHVAVPGRARHRDGGGVCRDVVRHGLHRAPGDASHDELRGRTFATLYTVIRLCLLLSLVVSPLWADFWDWFVGLFTLRAQRHAQRRELHVPRRAHRALGRRPHHASRRVLGSSLGARRRASMTRPSSDGVEAAQAT